MIPERLSTALYASFTWDDRRLPSIIVGISTPYLLVLSRRVRVDEPLKWLSEFYLKWLSEHEAVRAFGLNN